MCQISEVLPCWLSYSCGGPPPPKNTAELDPPLHSSYEGRYLPARVLGPRSLALYVGLILPSKGGLYEGGFSTTSGIPNKAVSGSDGSYTFKVDTGFLTYTSSYPIFLGATSSDQSFTMLALLDSDCGNHEWNSTQRGYYADVHGDESDHLSGRRLSPAFGRLLLQRSQQHRRLSENSVDHRYFPRRTELVTRHRNAA